MIEPTDKILEIFKKYDAKGLFFVDATFLTVLKKDYFEGYVKIKEQILDILKSGSDIGLHIHPHWIDSYMIDKNRWSFKSYENFRIHNLPKEKISTIIKDSFNELDTICKEFDKDYNIDSFRAGGWCIQPFNLIKDDLKSIGIKYDFSVLPGMKKDNLPKHYYDYKQAPQKDFWKFENDVLKEDDKGSFIEVPTTIVKMNIFDLLKLKKSIKGLKTIGDGKGADDSSSSFVGKMKKLTPFIKYTLSSDYMTLDMFKKNIQSVDKSVLVYVAHPKNFSDESFRVLEYVCNKYNTNNYKEIIYEN
ncbi:hypothetical protein [Aliarcobacter cryaerophilus]|uniref:hypothetical protein n=1 Tax=Aliarcobacter cryaerophilus TaxID=28198 RepID=UPI003DA3F683